MLLNPKSGIPSWLRSKKIKPLLGTIFTLAGVYTILASAGCARASMPTPAAPAATEYMLSCLFRDSCSLKGDFDWREDGFIYCSIEVLTGSESLVSLSPKHSEGRGKGGVLIPALSVIVIDRERTFNPGGGKVPLVAGFGFGGICPGYNPVLNPFLYRQSGCITCDVEGAAGSESRQILDQPGMHSFPRQTTRVLVEAQHKRIGCSRVVLHRDRDLCNFGAGLGSEWHRDPLLGHA